MNKNLIIGSLLMITISGTNCISKAQTNNQATDPSLQGQYNEILEKSNSIQDYKVVKSVKLSSFWKNAADTIKKDRDELIKAKAQIKAQNQIVMRLNQDIQAKDKSLNQSRAMIDEVKLLGISVSKPSYQIIMWGLVLILGLALSILAFLSKNYRKEANYRVKLFLDLSEEFQTHKVKANEKEKRLARELQTQMNKLEESGKY